MATQTERRNATRRAILESAITAFTTGDLSVSMEAIAADAGVTKGSVHYHFGSRTGLLRAVAEFVVARLESRIAAASDGVDVRTWIRAVLAEQATPVGAMLFAINDELARTGELTDADPFPYFSLRLAEFDIPSPPPVIAAAMIQYGRQLAFGNTTAASIDDVMADLDPLL